MSEFPVVDIAQYLNKEQTIGLEGEPIPDKVDIPRVENLPRQLVEIAESVARTSGTWNPVEIYTADADSIASEQQKVFDSYDQGIEYNPKFTYSTAEGMDMMMGRRRLMHQMHKLRQFGEKRKGIFQKRVHLGGKQSLDRSTRLFRTALYYKIKDDLATCDLVDGIKARDEEQIGHALKQKYPGTDQSLYDLAVAEYVRLTFRGDSDDDTETTGNALLSKDEISFLKEKELTASEVAEAFKWALSQYGILRTASNGKGFMVKVSKDATAIDVRSKSNFGPTVFVPEDRKMSAYELLPLIAHEIEGHARQETNGEETFMLGGGRLKIDNEQLYEGLGLRYEFETKKKLYGIKDPAPSPYYTLAAKMAEDGASFAQIFKDQVDKRIRVHLKRPLGSILPEETGIDKEKMDKIKRNAWRTTYRIMRGHTDMTNPKKFAMAKDLGYLRGFQMDKQLRDNDLGYINEEGVIASGGLTMLAEMKIPKDHLPHQFRNVTQKYWEEVLRPQMRYGTAAKAA